MKKHTAYVLTRLFYTDLSTNGSFMKRFTKTVQSVVRNAKNYKGGKVVWILYDDSLDSSDHEQILALYNKTVLAIFGKDEDAAKNCNIEAQYFCSEKPGNSAYATFCIRQKFLELTGPNESNQEADDQAFVVSLDQDDELEPRAINSIARKMTPKGVVLSPFTIINDGGKDITGDGGKIQRRLTRKISRGPIHNRAGHYFKERKENDLAKIYYASSLSWSKSYSRYAMSQYMTLLESFLRNNRGNSKKSNGDDAAYSFYNAHPSYEDFVDFFALLLLGITISATSENTHVYYKHSDAITCNPGIDDFRLHRTASLLLLIDLCYSNQSVLRNDFKVLLFRYITIKVVDIERILSGYRADYLNGKTQYRAFEEATHDNYFIRKLYRLAQGENRKTEQDKDLFEKAAPVRTESTKEHFDDLFSCESINRIPVYKSTLINADSRTVLECAVLAESVFRPVKTGKAEQKRRDAEKRKIESKKESDITKRYDKKKTPNQKRKSAIIPLICFWSFIIIFFLLWLIGIIPLWGCKREAFIKAIPEYSSIIAALTALIAAVLTFLLNEFSKVNILAKDEAAQKKLYYSEFEDLVRHLDANLKVLIEVRKQLSEGSVPASIHFINLSWPSTSCLFSDDIAKVLDKKKVDDFARLKVNLRNIQNSAEWLTSYVQEQHPYNELCNSIDWEIARHIGYLMNFKYLQNNNFQFPSQNELDYYIKEKHLKAHLSQLFMSYSGKPEHNSDSENYSRMEMVDKYLDMYYDDRRMRRSVLIYKNDMP